MSDHRRRDPRTGAPNSTHSAATKKFTVQQVANLLSGNCEYLQRLLDEGRIPFAQTLDGIRIRAAELLPFKREWEAKRREKHVELTRLTEESDSYERRWQQAAAEDKAEPPEREP